MNGNQDRLPALLGGVYGAKDIASRATAAKKEMPALLQDIGAAKEEGAISEFRAGQGVKERTAAAERQFADKSREAATELESGVKPYQEFQQPEYKASDYAANAAARLFTGLMIGGVAKTSAIGQLKAVRDMQKAEDQGLREQFATAKIQFDEAEKARKDFNDNLKQRFDRMIKLLSSDRAAALAEGKIIEASLGEGAIRANIRAGNLQKAYDQFNKFVDANDRLEMAREVGKIKAEQAIDVAQARAESRPAAAAKEEKPISLPSGIEKKLENVGSTKVSMDRMSQTAKPQFFGVAPSDAIANLIVSGVEKGLPVGDIVSSITNAPKVTNDTVLWWKDYQEFVSQVRNKLFGATLTGREADDFRKFTISPATDPAIATDYLNRQVRLVNEAARREADKAISLRVPEKVVNSYLGFKSVAEQPKTFASEADANAAFARGEIKKGERIIVGGQSGIYE